MEQYIELLYDDRGEKRIVGARNIMMLCLIPRGLELMFEHESLMGVLTRTLKDEYKKNIDLTIYLLGTFLAISNYYQFIEILLENQVGDATMKIVDFQIKRGNVLLAELRKRLDSLAAMGEEKERRKELEQEIRKYQNLIKKQDKLFCCKWLANGSVLQHTVQPVGGGGHREENGEEEGDQLLDQDDGEEQHLPPHLLHVLPQKTERIQ